MTKARGGRRPATARDGDDWQTEFTFLWIELIEKHGQAAALASQLEAPELQKEIRAQSQLLEKLEDTIRRRLMGDDSGADAADAPAPTTAHVRVPPPKQKAAPVNSLDAYLTRSPPVDDGDDEEGDASFVNSVRGWDAPPRAHARGAGAAGGLAAAPEEAFELDGIELHDLMMQNNARNVGVAAAPPAVFQRPSVPTQATPRVSVQPQSAKKRKLSAAASPSRHLPEQPSRREVGKLVKTLVAVKVLKYREGNHLCEYLVEWDGRNEPLWVQRKQCADQGKHLIDAFNRRRKTTSGRAPARHQSTRQDAPVAADYSADGDDIFIVDKIVDHRVRHGKKQYLVKWDGYDSSDNTWESATKLQADVTDVVNAYERRIVRGEQEELQRAASPPARSSLPSAAQREVATNEQGESNRSAGGSEEFEASKRRVEREDEERHEAAAPKPMTSAQNVGDGNVEMARSVDVEAEVSSNGGPEETGGAAVVGASDSEDHDLA